MGGKMKRGILRLLALLLAFGMVAASCGSDDDGSAGSDSSATADASDDSGDSEEEEEKTGTLSQEDIEEALDRLQPLLRG